MAKHILMLLSLLLLMVACKEDTTPKPKAFLRLAYTEASYQKPNTACPYSFEYSTLAEAKSATQCWVNIHYPQLKASINMTYRPVEDNLKELLLEAEKLTYKHAIKADEISAQPFENQERRTYGSLLEVSGNAASPLQFHLTDSTKHFITGALYFEVQPNYDSILPAIKYLEQDIKHLMETFEWKSAN